MSDNIGLYFVIGLLVCFLGTLPFGPINLTVVKTTVDSNQRQGLEIALAASLVEIIEALIAICFGMVISLFLQTNIYIRVAIAVGFIVLGFYVWFRKEASHVVDQPKTAGKGFKRGLLIAALNPQSIPFWIVALAAIGQYFSFVYQGVFLLVFLLGVFLGKLLALTGFVLVSNFLKTHLQDSARLVNRVLAVVLILIGVTQIGQILDFI